MKYLAGLIITIVLIIFAFFLIFRGGDDKAAPNTPPKLVSYANTDTQVRMTTEYPVSSEQTHRQTVVTVGRDAATLSYERGYEGQVIRSQSYPNNETAYADFLGALQVAGFTRAEDSEELRDERGKCPQGRRYIYEIFDGDRTIQRYWSSSCGNIGTFKGRSELVNNLFQKQIPDYAKLTANTQ